jgi:hypothetical protein
MGWTKPKAKGQRADHRTSHAQIALFCEQQHPRHRPHAHPRREYTVGAGYALASHQPIDLLTIMLGTNDLKTRFAPSAATVTAGMVGLLDIALNADLHVRHGGSKFS